jgi:hypothetical protein
MRGLLNVAEITVTFVKADGTYVTCDAPWMVIVFRHSHQE